MSKFQRDKGKRGERMFARLLTDLGFDAKTGKQLWEARRGVQYQGGPDSPDIVCPALPIHWEVKNAERLSVRDAYSQADSERALGNTPVVAWKKSNCPWLVILSADDFCDILRQSDLVKTTQP